jgi:DNA polymerase-3 subunit gamma/tau
LPASGDDTALLERLAALLSREEVQLYYQIAIHAQRDLPLAPDPHTGFTMTLLRMLAFRPEEGGTDQPGPGSESGMSTTRGTAASTGARAQALEAPSAARAVSPGRASNGPARSALHAALRRPQTRAHSRAEAGGPVVPAPVPEREPADVPAPVFEPESADASVPVSEPAGTPLVAPAPAPVQAAAAAPVQAAAPAFEGDWPALVAQLRAGGMAAQFLQQSALVEHEGLAFRVRVPIRPLAEPSTVKRVREALAAHFGQEVRLTVEVGAIEGPTAAALAGQRRAEQQAGAQAAIEADPFVQALLKDFGGTIVPGSVRPAAPT